MKRRFIATALIAASLSGCGFLSRTKSRFFDLERVPPAGATRTAGGVPVGIDIVELPPGMDRREVVVHTSDAGVEVRERDQWTASLEPLVLHTLAFNLASRLQEGAVILPGAAKPVRMRSVDVVFEELAAGPEQVLVLDARWMVRQTGQPDVSHHERITTQLSSLDSAEIARGLSAALGTLADRIAAGL